MDIRERKENINIEALDINRKGTAHTSIIHYHNSKLRDFLEPVKVFCAEKDDGIELPYSIIEFILRYGVFPFNPFREYQFLKQKRKNIDAIITKFFDKYVPDRNSKESIGQGFVNFILNNYKLMLKPDTSTRQGFRKKLSDSNDRYKLYTAGLFFNVVGCSSRKVSNYYSINTPVTILFNINPFLSIKGRVWIRKHTESIGDADRFGVPFNPDLTGLSRDKYWTKLPKETFARGYMLAGRIPPRFFTGVVIGGRDIYYGKIEIGMLLDNARKVAKIMEKVGVVLPVYSIRGDLLWPEFKDYEDIKDK